MIKKIISILTILTLLLTLPLAVSAQENSSVNITEEESEILRVQKGAEMRFAQFVRVLDIHINNANHLVQRLETSNNSDVDYEKLDSIISDLEVLQTEIESFDTTQDKEIVIEAFVNFKKEAHNLSKEFRLTISEVLSEEEIEELREEVKERKEEKLKQKNERIEKLKNEFRSHKVKELGSVMGINVTELREVMDGRNVTKGDVKKYFVDEFKSLDKESKKEVINKLKEHKHKVRIEHKERLDNFFEKQKEIRENRINEIRGRE